MLTTDEIIFGYRYILGRDPTPQDIEAKRKIADFQTLRQIMMRSPEAQRDRANRENIPAAPKAPAYVFQHLPKCAGSSVHEALLSSLGDTARMCPERHNGLWNYALRDLRGYTLFSGHFDKDSVDLIPVADKRVFTILRDPEARLLSLYRYLRALRPSAPDLQKRAMQLSAMARDLNPEAFFGHAQVRTNPSIDNAMVRALSGTLPGRSWEAHSPELAQTGAQAPMARPELERAVRHLEGMTGFGIVEQLDTTLPAVFQALGLTDPGTILARNVTKSLHADNPAFEEARPVRKTRKLRQLLKDLTEQDRALYDHGLNVLRGRGLMGPSGKTRSK